MKWHISCSAIASDGAPYHDLWLSEGFAEFAAGLFLQQAVGPKWQKDDIDFWEGLRTRILEKKQFRNRSE